VRPYIKHVNVGSRSLYPVKELEKWLDRNAHGA
jgi:hypothetical protein